MTEKRYYYRDYEELYYIFDSNTISEKEFDEKEEYEGYTAFEDSLTTEEIVNLLNENEQLKSIIKEVIELLSEEVDVFSDKATEHDINAYIELKELDNKDAYYMATATKKAIRMLKELQE